MSKSVVELTSNLVRFPSVSRVSNVEVSQFIADLLAAKGFEVERIPFTDEAGVAKLNLVARRLPQQRSGPVSESGFAYLAHNDVVPADDWIGSPQLANDKANPFEPALTSGDSEIGERLYARGACDMKGSIAAMLCAVERVSQTEQSSPLWFVVTADEEVGFGGAKRVVQDSEFYQQMIDAQPMSIIGEPTCLEVVHAHKGIRGFQVLSRGRAAHSSTRDGRSATLPMVPMLTKLHAIYERTESEASLQDKRYDPPTLTWNLGFEGDGSAVNVTPAFCKAWVSLRTMPGVDGQELVDQARSHAEELGLEFQEFSGSGPLWVEPTETIVAEMLRITGSTTPRTVCYGTDGGVFTGLKRMIVCGPGDIAQAHTVDEWVSVEQLKRGVDVYEQAIRTWCC